MLLCDNTVYLLIFRHLDKVCGFLRPDESYHLLIPSSILQFTIIVIVFYCDITFFVLCLKHKSFAMDEELYRYVLHSSHLPDSPSCSDTLPGHVSWRDHNLELSRLLVILRALQLWAWLSCNRRSWGSLTITSHKQRQGQQECRIFYSNTTLRSQLPKLVSMVQGEDQ